VRSLGCSTSDRALASRSPSRSRSGRPTIRWANFTWVKGRAGTPGTEGRTCSQSWPPPARPGHPRCPCYTSNSGSRKATIRSRPHGTPPERTGARRRSPPRLQKRAVLTGLATLLRGWPPRSGQAAGSQPSFYIGFADARTTSAGSATTADDDPLARPQWLRLALSLVGRRASFGSLESRVWEGQWTRWAGERSGG